MPVTGGEWIGAILVAVTAAVFIGTLVDEVRTWGWRRGR